MCDKQPAPAKIGLFGLAFDENSSYLRGAALAPAQIRAAFASASSNCWAENGANLGESSLLADFGDIQPSQAEMPQQTAEIACRVYEAGLKVFALGGDHSVSYPLVKAAARYHSGLTILHFDAHPDLYDNFENNPHSHASPFARIMENGLARRLVQVGLRTANAHQREQAARFGVEMLEMSNWQQVFDLTFDSPLYLSFDLDCLDPAYAPGVSHWEPGGLSTREALTIIQALSANIVAADLVEFNPTRDESGRTGMVCAKLFKEIAARMV